jgi:tetratricopeptide (TPR) repeat protein
MHMLAICAEPDGQADLNRAAIERARASNQPGGRKWLGSLLNNLGWSLFEEKKITEDLVTFEEALAFRIELGKRIREAKWAVARALRELGKINEALEIQLEIVSGEPDGYVHEELALLYREKACEHAKTAVALFSADEWFCQNSYERVAHMKELGE